MVPGDKDLCKLVADELVKRCGFKYKYRGQQQVGPHRSEYTPAYCLFTIGGRRFRLAVKNGVISLLEEYTRKSSPRHIFVYVWKILKGCNPLKPDFGQTWASYWKKVVTKRILHSVELCDPDCFDKLETTINNDINTLMY